MCPDAKALQEATITVRTAEDTLAGAVKLYGAMSPAEAEQYHTLAHAALDTLLDAGRRQHRAFAALVRQGRAS